MEDETHEKIVRICGATFCIGVFAFFGFLVVLYFIGGVKMVSSWFN